MDTALFDYVLPETAIAQFPSARRDAARLMVVNRKTREVTHAIFSELNTFLPANTQLLRNNAKVFKARLRATRANGAAVECFLLHPDAGGHDWWCLLRPGKKCPVDSFIYFAEGSKARVVEKKPEGECRLEWHFAAESHLSHVCETCGEIPLPPYIHRNADQSDLDRYQTVYASGEQEVAVAAPTAGLHFTPELIQALLAAGHTFHDLTLHVGLGTFKPIQSDQLEGHTMHRERYEIPTQLIQAFPRLKTHPLLCVGTTSLRGLEAFSRNPLHATALAQGQAFYAEADLFIYPPNQFSADHLLTNFHLPRSTLMCLVSAFLTPGSMEGITWLKELYAIALEKQYRFFSYGDAMLIL
jgi:S-adenosylmethionine:tRNA ribosyltransferase-isomerase